MVLCPTTITLCDLEMGKKILEELHKGVCSSYIGGRALAVIFAVLILAGMP